jgi:hypothetical protein
MHMTVPGTDRRFAALHNSGSSTPTSGRHAQAVSGYSSPGLATTKGDDRADCCSRHRHKGLASVRVRRDHDASRPPLLILIAAPFSSRLSRHIRHHFPQYSYQKGYLGIVYIAIGQS